MGRYLYLLLLGGIGAWIIRSCAFDLIVIASASMEPTLEIGKEIFVSKMAYKTSKPKRGDIVVFPSPIEEKELVKRIIGIEGDTILIKRKKVILNGKPLDEPYVIYKRENEILKGDNLDVGHVPKGKVFVMGDNRDHSGDSRDWINPKTKNHIFFIKVNDIKGKLVGKYVP